MIHVLSYILPVTADGETLNFEKVGFKNVLDNLGLPKQFVDSNLLKKHRFEITSHKF